MAAVAEEQPRCSQPSPKSWAFPASLTNSSDSADLDDAVEAQAQESPLKEDAPHQHERFSAIASKARRTSTQVPSVNITEPSRNFDAMAESASPIGIANVSTSMHEAAEDEC